MQKREIEALLSDLPGKIKDEWLLRAPNIIGFLVKGEEVTALSNEPEDPKRVERGFLALGQPSCDPIPKDHYGPKDVCSIGLSLAHAFPRTVRGNLSGIVKTTSGHRYLLSVNHVVWMNGWAQPGSKIVSNPFSNPPFTKVGFVSSPKVNNPLQGCLYLNTLQELALAEVDYNYPDLPLPCPVDCDPGLPVFRLDCSRKLRKACVECTDFRFALRFEYGRFLFWKQILLRGESTYEAADACGKQGKKPFAERGDSGSLLFQETDDGFAPVAVLWAGSPDHQSEFDQYVAVPLKPYFEHCHLEFVNYRVPQL